MATDPVLDWLLEPADPPVRLRTLTDLMGCGEDDPDVRKARQAVMAAGPIPRLLAEQNEDGSFGDPTRFYTDKYEGSAWTLLLLAELGADGGDPRVRRACEFILRRSRNPETGGFSYTSGVRTGQGLESGVIPCLTGNMAFSLVRLGMLGDDRAVQAIQWILRWQRADDGDTKPPKGPPYDRYEMCWGRHSCHMGVAKALKALAAIPEPRRSPEVRAKIDEFLDYFFRHHLYKRSHNLAEIAKPGWLKLGFPLMYQTDILELMEICATLGRWDPRLQDALDILKGKVLPDGRCRLENSFNGKMRIRIDQKGQPSKWITLKVQRVLRRFAESGQGGSP